ncbi:metallopeptidase family protein [bacterium]|nr:metallopeptidase family protein [bacterium]
MKKSHFEKLVNEGLALIPKKSLEKIKNVALLIADYPTEEQLNENDIPADATLLGLYEGIPLIERGEHYGIGMTLPDRITIFQKPIEEAGGGDADAIRRIVAETVAHEIAHHFGMDEHEVEEWETKKSRVL